MIAIPTEGVSVTIDPRALTPRPRLHIDGKLYRVEGILKRHRDDSVSYKAVGTSKAIFVVRAFMDSTHAPAQLLRSKIDASQQPSGLIDYISVGSARVDGDLPPRFPKSQSVVCSVRPYRKQTLQDFGKDNSGSSDLDALTTITTLATGLLALHSAGMTHGDLRPSNVIVDAAKHTALVDYGVSVDLKPQTTPRDALFAAPEILRAGAVSMASDVYSFGKLTRAVLRSSSEIDRASLERLSALIEKCLVDEPSARPGIADVVEEMLASDRGGNFLDRLERNRLASFADLDARAPGLIEAHPMRTDRAVSTVFNSLNSIASHRPLHRLRQLNDAESTHLIATLSFLQLRQRRVQYTGSSDILRAMEYAPADTSDVNPAWRDRLLDIMQTPSVEDEQALREKYSFMPERDLDLMLAPFSKEEIAGQLRLASEARADILSQDAFVNSEHVAAVMSESCPGVTMNEVRILRDMGYLLSVEDSGHNIYPLFQFERRSGLPYQAIRDVDDIFAATDPSGWGRMSWWFSPNRFLQSGTPAEHIRDGHAPDLVTDALRRVLAA